VCGVLMIVKPRQWGVHGPLGAITPCWGGIWFRVDCNIKVFFDNRQVVSSFHKKTRVSVL
jgi:hypothetical protein